MHRMGLFPMIFITGLLLIDSISVSAVRIDSEVSKFENNVYQNAQSTKSKACTAFHQGFAHEPDLTFEEMDQKAKDQEYLRIDCDRYRRALACYQDIQKSKGTNGKPAEKDLNPDRTKIERACGL